ncbi:MAG: signal peptidase I [Deltaproteobacteria bacterium]|nr:signal peptidase I [Deltaproteobacteria bacterium]
MRRLAQLMIALALASSGLAAWALATRARPVAPQRQPQPPGEVRTVRGGSMEGIVEPGQRVQILRGYFRDHPVQRGDLVAYGEPQPIVKEVRAVPGDSFEVRSIDGAQRLFVNAELVRTSNGTPYALDAHAARMLGLYAHDYQGKVPADAFLLLGNLPGGSFDSTHFGLVARRDLVGKVER